MASGVSMGHKVVAHLLDGRLIKGLAESILPDRPLCHVLTRERGMLTVYLADLKALFIVRDFEGNSKYVEQQTIEPADPRATGAQRLQIVFRDGERLLALATTYEATQPLFFATPADPQSNNIRILVNRAAVESVTVLPMMR
jgi:hypothetical protein